MSSEGESKTKVTTAPLQYFVGIEGGASSTNGVLIDNKRNQIAEATIAATNPWVTGFIESAKMLKGLIEELGSKLPDGNHLSAVGMSLSGAGQVQSRTQLMAELKGLSLETEDLFIGEDTLAPVFAISNRGGVNIIVGTGSNCVVYNPNGTSTRVGGWGHILGDEGSAYYIAHLAIKTLLDDSDGYRKCAFGTDAVRKELFKYLDISQLEETLVYIYKDFSKEKIAGFTVQIAKLAEANDALAKHLFYQAGYEIGRHLVCIRPHCDPAVVKNGELKVICTGSVFKSWKHLKPGFMDAVKPKKQSLLKQRFEKILLNKKAEKGIKDVSKISLFKLKGNAAVGAAIWAARRKKINVSSSRAQDSIEVIDTILLGETV